MAVSGRRKRQDSPKIHKHNTGADIDQTAFTGYFTQLPLIEYYVKPQMSLFLAKIGKKRRIFRQRYDTDNKTPDKEPLKEYSDLR